MGILDQRNRGDFFVRNLGRDPPYRRCVSESSFNGAVSAWMYKYPAGIRLSPDASAFKKILIQPCFLSDLDFVEASHESMYGTIRVDWRREEGKIRLHLVLPSTAMGTVVLPGQKPKAVKGANTFCHSRIVNMFV